VARSTAPRVRLYIDKGELDDATEQFKGIAERASDAKPVLRAIQALMVDAGMEQFETQGSSTGEAWQPDTKEWAERKGSEGLSDETLVRHGKLREAMMAKTGGGSTIRRLSKHSTTVGVRLFYARFVGHVPEGIGKGRRRLLTMTVPAMDRYATMMIDYIIDGKVG
jgi:Phage virion morphogenesis family